ncbi:MAG: antiterminator LoaP [Spirochaetales bacterium]|nr:antiterminator LoaP [Spirochaetales bacterium]
MMRMRGKKMSLFVMQVETGQEQRFVRQSRSLANEYDAEVIHLRRKLKIRRKGFRREVVASVFPGYVFLKTNAVPPRLYWGLRKKPGFFRFLNSNYDIMPLQGRDSDIFFHFFSYGDLIKESLVIFDVDSRIVVLDGPLKGLEGNIIRVDRRKKRARVRLDVYDESFEVDFGFEVMAESKAKEREAASALEIAVV